MSKKQVQSSKKADTKSKEIHRVEPDLKSGRYGIEEQKRIVEMIEQDVVADTEVMKEYKEQKRLDLMHYNAERPSLLENLTKENWHSDRNLGLCPAICDIYQSTLKSTVWNPNSIHAIATEKNDVDNKDNLMKFAKWAVGPNEGDLESEIDDFIHNKITQGVSVFKIDWKVWYEWVDKRIWNERRRKYDVKTEYIRFEKGCMENIDDIDDFLAPRYGSDIQQLPHCIHIIHMFGRDVLANGENKVFLNVDEKWVESAKRECLHRKKEYTTETLGKEKADHLGLSDVTDEDLRSLPVDLYVWYGYYERHGRNEKYRFVVELNTNTFLSGKPLRKINRGGKYPFIGGPFIRMPGLIRGKSLPHRIAPIVNAYNTTWNQKADFQFITNCPFGFYKPDEHYRQQEYSLMPGIMYPTAEPNEINIPNIQRSMAWADYDIRQLFEMLEKLTGAASYFQTTERNTSGTATRDRLVAQQSGTRFGLWVARLQDEICKALTMFIQLYQDWAPPKLGDRVLGEEGEKIFPNLSIESLRGNYDIRMEPDVTAGSKAYEQEMQLWGWANLQQSIWLDPRVNPKGNWKLTSDTMKKMGLSERYLPPEPPAEMGTSDDIKDEWTRIAQGEVFDPPEGATQRALEHLIGHTKQKQEKYYKLDDEYKKNLDIHIFKTWVNYQTFMRQVQQERMADMVAMNVIQKEKQGLPNEVNELAGRQA